MCPRTLYPAVSARPEFARTGAYVLVGEAEDGADGSRVYVGESDHVGNRIKSHDLNKNFWDHLVVITKTDGSLHKTDVRYLESKLVDLANKSPTVSVENGTTPTPPEPVESHKADLDAFLIDTLAILRILGVSAFSADSAKSGTPGVLKPPSPEQPEPLNAPTGEYFFSVGKASGKMTVDQDGYTLLPGDGVARGHKPSLSGTYKTLRDKFLANGTLEPLESDKEHLRLTVPVRFSSPSAAAAVVYGASINGRLQWKDSSGKTLADREQDAMSE